MRQVTEGLLMKYIVVGALLASVAACSHEQVYSAVQQNRQFECSKLPQPEYEECMRETGMSYDEYERRRQELLKED